MIIRFSLAVLSASLLALSFPNFNYWPFAWIGLVPILFAIDGQKPLRAFLISYLSGVVFFLGTIYWLIHVTLPGTIVVALYLALYFGLFGLLASFFLRDLRPKTYDLLFAIPSIWIILEWLRSHLLTGFGWVLLGHSQSQALPIIQIADCFGAYGVSFLVAIFNTGLFITIKNFREKKNDTTAIAIALFLVFLSLSYGIIRLKNVFTGEKIKVAVIQGNIPQERKWDSGFREEILRRYEALTIAAAKEKPDLIIWPETSVPGFLEGEKDLSRRVTDAARNAAAPLLAGTVREDARSDYYNSAVLISSSGEVLGRYDKLHLVPFGEYVPFKRSLSFVEKFAPIPIGDCAPGKEYTVFSFFVKRSAAGEGVSWKKVKKVRFASLICFEDIFPELSREFMKRNANFLVVITNDAWYKATSAPFQHAQNSIFRAVENRTNVIRAANTGLSCFIDQKGEVRDVVESGGDIFVSGFRVHELTLNTARTIYTVYGDIFVYICVAAVFIAILRRRF